MKKFLALVLTAVMMLSMIPFGFAAADDTYTIGVCWYWLSGEFMSVCKNYMDMYIEEYEAANPGKLKVIQLDGAGDPNTQISQVENLISQGVDLILLNPWDRIQLAAATEMCHEAGIPVIEFNVETDAKDYRLTYVGSDHYDSGYVTAKCLIEAMGGKGNIAVLKGPSGHDAELARTQALEDVLKEYPEVKVVAEEYANWMRDQGMAATENWLQADLGINGIFGENDEMALGAIEALKGTEFEGKVLVAGIDGLPDALNAIREGSLLCTAIQSAKKQAQWSIDYAIKYLNGATLEPYYDTGFPLITLENVDDPEFDTSDAYEWAQKHK